MTLEGEVRKFFWRHPGIGALAFILMLTGVIVLAGSLYDRLFGYAPQAILAICVTVFVLMILAGNRHFS